MIRFAALIALLALPCFAEPKALSWPHEKTAAPGAHPRLVVSPEEVEGLRAKVNAPGSLSAFLWSKVVKEAPTFAGIPDFWPAVHASAPVMALLCEKEEDRKKLARVAIDSALACIREWEPPYPNEPEWLGRFIYRYIALTYDCCYSAMTDAERTQFRDEIEKICALVASGGPEGTTNNHAIAFATGMLLGALAIEGDDPAVARTYADVEVKRGALMPEGDFLPHRSSTEIQKVGRKPGGSEFVQGKDWDRKWMRHPTAHQQEGYGVFWVKGGQAPAEGETYYVTYQFVPDIPAWKDSARSAIQRNLDQTWGDGASTAGPMYGPWTINWMLDDFEAMRRCMGIDFARHPNARDAVLWLPTELLATDKPQLRANNHNDANYEQLDGMVRSGPLLAWVQTRFKGDAGKRDLVGAWLMSRSEAWIQWAAWREAIWCRDDLLGPPPFKCPTKLDLPLSKFFRGFNLSNFRTGDWDGDMNDWSLFSLVGGPFVGPEHDQTDKGSFTFYALGEDFAIDSGYAQGDVKSDASAAHNLVLIDGKGQPGPWGTTAFVRAHFLSGTFDATHADLKTTWLNAQGWGAPKDAKPAMWPVRAADRWAMFMKLAGRAPYAVVADSIDKDGADHDFEWLLHTQEGNRIAIDGGRVTITGRRGKGTLAVHLLCAGTPELRQDSIEGHEFPAHPRLILKTKTKNPCFFALLVPEKTGETAPLVVKQAPGDGCLTATVTFGTSQDAIVFNPGLLPVKALGLETDAALAAVRTGDKGSIAGWIVFDATVLKLNGKTLWQSAKPRGVRGSACFDGKTLAVDAPDATDFKALAPGAKDFASGDVTLPGTASTDWLTWTGKRPLRDTLPAGIPALSEDFTDACAPYFFVWPRGKVRCARPVDGEFCLPGLRAEWVSWTRRTYTPFRADVIQWPRTIYADSILRGDATLLDRRPGTVWRIQTRVSDRTYGEDWVPLDQDFVQVEVNLDKSEAVLSMKVDGKVVPLGTGKTGPIIKGKKLAFELSLQGNVAKFSLGGAVKVQATDKSGKLPASGYFQFEGAEGLHLHLDNLRVTIEP